MKISGRGRRKWKKIEATAENMLASGINSTDELVDTSSHGRAQLRKCHWAKNQAGRDRSEKCGVSGPRQLIPGPRNPLLKKRLIFTRRPKPVKLCRVLAIKNLSINFANLCAKGAGLNRRKFRLCFQRGERFHGARRAQSASERRKGGSSAFVVMERKKAL